MKTTNKIALTGIIAAISFGILFAASIVPNSKIFLFGAASLPIFVVLIECGYQYAFIHYVATSYLAFILLPNKYAVLPYIIVLGAYGIIKGLAEKNKNPIVEWAIKLIYFNATLGLYLFLAFKFFFTYVSLPVSLWVMILGSNALFIVYDVIYSYCIAFYESKIRKKIWSR